jgi:hypothetical protein
MDATKQTKEHIKTVGLQINKVIQKLSNRSLNHDKSKLKEPEKSLFDIYTRKLKNTTYGSIEYKQYLKELKPALDHHYTNNRHHPEHFNNDFSKMNLVDLIEMICDWNAATLRHDDGDIYKSLEINKKRFNIPDILMSILQNTVDDVLK